MNILTIRTDKPESEIGIYSEQSQLDYYSWEAHRQLAETINTKISEILKMNELELEALDGIVAYKGPGSFTGLRIGLTVANALSDSLNIPIVSENGKEWQVKGAQRLIDGQNERTAMPEYGAPPHITKPKH